MSASTKAGMISFLHCDISNIAHAGGMHVKLTHFMRSAQAPHVCGSVCTFFKEQF